MKISQLIKKLQEQQELVGDTEVHVGKYGYEEKDVYFSILEIKKNKPYYGITIFVD